MAINHDNNEIIAYTFGRRQDKVFKKFKGILEPLEPLGITMYYTDDWGIYDHIPDNQHTVGKKNTQAIERTNLTLRDCCLISVSFTFEKPLEPCGFFKNLRH